MYYDEIMGAREKAMRAVVFALGGALFRLSNAVMFE